jgi:hypothetical protein
MIFNAPGSSGAAKLKAKPSADFSSAALPLLCDRGLSGRQRWFSRDDPHLASLSRGTVMSLITRNFLAGVWGEGLEREVVYNVPVALSGNRVGLVVIQASERKGVQRSG